MKGEPDGDGGAWPEALRRGRIPRFNPTSRGPIADRSGPVSEPVLMHGRTGKPDPSVQELASLRRQLQREREARRLAEQLVNRGAEEILREQSELMLLGRVAVAANEATSLPGVAEECLALVARHAGWPAATLWICETGDPRPRPCRSWFGAGGNSFAALAEAVSSRIAAPEGSLPHVVATSGAPKWLGGLDRREGWLRDERDSGLGVRTAMAVPVWAGRDIAGVVGVFNDAGVERCDRLLELVEQVVTQLGVVMSRLSSECSMPVAEPAPGPVPPPPVFVAEVAHDVRTPLNGIIGNLELLCESHLDPDQRDLSALALQSAIDLHERVEAWLQRGC